MKRLAPWLLLPLATLCAADMRVSTQTPVVKTLECLRANAPKQLRVDELRIEAQGQTVSTRQLTGRFLSRREAGGLRAMLQVTAPADLAGMRYLLIEEAPEDALYLYLPALGKVRRVSGAGPEAEIAGTTLNYADLRLIGQALSAASITLDKPVDFMGRSADVLRFVPAVADSPYRRIMATVDRERCVILRAEFQNAQQTLKQYQIDPASLTQAGDYRYASLATVEDRINRSTVKLALRGVRVDGKLSARNFDPRTFHKLEH